MPKDYQVSKQVSSSIFYNTNIITFFLNGKVKISGEMMLGVLPGNEHCLKVGTDIIPLKKGDNNVVYLHNETFQIPFTLEKRDGRYFLRDLQNEGFGLMRFISTSQEPAIITPDPGLQVLAKNMHWHQDVIYLFKTNTNCKFQYSISEIISDNEKLIGIREKKYEDKIVLSSKEGFVLERRVQ